MKLKIGDLELDSQSNIEFASRAPVDRVQAQLPSQSERAQQASAAFGACSAAVGLASFLGAIAATPWLGIVSGAAVLLSFGAFVNYFLIGHTAGDSSSARTEIEDDEDLGRLRRERLLGALDAQATVDELVDRLGWSEKVVLKTLQQLISRDEIEEDLALDTGVWTYRKRQLLLVEQRPLETLSLEDRIEAIQTTQHTSKVKS
jgi:hypothetical protein